jgi:hypothetical protein
LTAVDEGGAGFVALVAPSSPGEGTVSGPAVRVGAAVQGAPAGQPAPPIVPLPDRSSSVAGGPEQLAAATANAIPMLLVGLDNTLRLGFSTSTADDNGPRDGRAVAAELFRGRIGERRLGNDVEFDQGLSNLAADSLRSVTAAVDVALRSFGGEDAVQVTEAMEDLVRSSVQSLLERSRAWLGAAPRPVPQGHRLEEEPFALPKPLPSVRDRGPRLRPTNPQAPVLPAVPGETGLDREEEGDRPGLPIEAEAEVTALVLGVVLAALVPPRNDSEAEDAAGRL